MYKTLFYALAAATFRIAELLSDKLSEPEHAVAVYEAALEDDPTHAGCLAALETIAQDPSSPFRREAARAAAPHYESLQRFDKLLAILRIVDALDPALHRGVNARRLRIERHAVFLSLRCAARGELALLRLQQRKELFEKVFHRELHASV